MSKLEVDAIEPQSGTTLTLGANGDAVNIASGASITDFKSTGIDDNATSTAITIDSSENVGIGTSSPSEKLHVDGNIQNQYGVTQPLYLKASSTGNTTGVITITPIFNQCGIIHINSFHNSFIPFYGRGGSGVSFTIFWGDIDTGFTTSSSFSYTESGSNANTYTVSMAGNNGQLSIERTSGSQTYNVYVYKWSI